MENEPVPEWLNADFLIGVLGKEVKGDKINITKFDIEPAVPKGDNFSSYLSRVIVSFTFLDETKTKVNKTSNLIIKGLPMGELQRMMIIQGGNFKREIEIYASILPAMYKLQQEKFGPKAYHFSSKCLYAEQDIIVMNDLCQEGYRMADRRKGLDLPHCKVALKSLSRFHGLSVGLFYQNRESMDTFVEGFYREESLSILEGLFIPGMKYLASVVEKWPGYERFAEKINALAENSVHRMIDTAKPVSDSLSVLNHGDFWINNILFSYDENTNEVVDPMFVDFQISRFSSPCLDLQFFMCSSPTDDVRYNHMDELLELYHQELRETLSALGCEHVKFSLQQLKKEFDEKGIFGFITGSMFLQTVLAEKSDAMDIDKLKVEDFNVVEGNPLFKPFHNPVFRDRYQKLLIYYENKGVI